MPRRPAIIAYDIAADKRRRRVARHLRSWRLDGQYSLTECRLTEAEAEELLLELTDLIEPAEDSLLLAWLDGQRRAAAVTRCARVAFQSPALYIGRDQ